MSSSINQSTANGSFTHDDGSVPHPTNHLVTALLTDVYQVTMTYAHWKNNRHNHPATFELFFRKNPFGGEYTIFAGLDECIKYITHFSFSAHDITYLKSIPSLQHCDDAFFDWLGQLNTKQNAGGPVRIYAIKDGTVAFPRVPLIVVEAPLALGQLLETTLLTLVNYPSLLATNAARMVRAAQSKQRWIDDAISDDGNDKATISGQEESTRQRRRMRSSSTGSIKKQKIEILPAQCFKTPICIEFGLRRAQGPDGGFSASKYAYLGGFAGTSNLQAGKLCHLKVYGTHAHAFIQTYSSLEDASHLQVKNVKENDGSMVDMLPKVLEYRKKLTEKVDHAYSTTNDGELAAFLAYAVAFPNSFLCLIDTYDTIKSGLLNYVMVAMVLDDCGYKPLGIRLDSGDLAYLSMECGKVFASFADERPFFDDLDIVASNDINEAVLHAINKEDHAITTYGIGTNLVTCQAQPALGCVYKLVEVSGKPRMKLSQEITKVLIPGKKKPYRLYGKDGRPLLDVLLSHDEPEPQAGHRILCRHPFDERKRAAVTPSSVEPLHVLIFENGKVIPHANRTFDEARKAVLDELERIRPDILRFVNPTPYKVSVSPELFSFLHDLWQSEVPVAELS